MSTTHWYLVKRYLAVGRLLHLIAFCDVVLVVVSIFLLLSDAPSLTMTVIAWTCMIMFVPQFLLAELDSYSRLQNYKQLKDQLYFHGFQSRIMRPMVKSRCQRDAALVACRELGLESTAKDFYRTHGYKWYHVPPDFVFTHPQFFFSSYFWRSTFFVPYYQSRVDYNKVMDSGVTLATNIHGIEVAR